MKPTGRCKVIQKGLAKIDSAFPNIPAVKRHIKYPDKQMNYSTAIHIYEETNVPVNEFIEIPSAI